LPVRDSFKEIGLDDLGVGFFDESSGNFDGFAGAGRPLVLG
jgi:hypothetical protein